MRHGGDLLSFQKEWSGSFLDYSSNINPLGYPAVLRQLLVDSMEDLTRYPDIQYRELRNAVSEYLGCNAAETILGNGAVEIIDGMVRGFKRVIVFVPCFIEYAERAQHHGCEVVKLPMDAEFGLDPSSLEAVMQAGDLVVLGNPNNPTGRRIGKEQLLKISSVVDRCQGFLLLDEAFYEFCPKDYDSIQLLSNKENVCVIRAATKFFALPGIRLGYAWTSVARADDYNRSALPWSINSFANCAGISIFKEKDYILKSKQHMAEQREFLIQGLQQIDTLKVYPTDCNFILLKLLKAEHNQDNLFEFMVRRGILIRKASSFDGLDKSYIRLAIKGQEDNERLIRSLHLFFASVH